jgi:predicted amidohydrolase
MNIYALELDNDIKGIEQRKDYIESLIKKLEKPDLVVLPELAMPSYMGNDSIWQFADPNSTDTADWAMSMARKYGSYLAVGYVEYSNGDYYNSYLIADKNQVFGIVRKSESESFVFKRGYFPNIIATPFGNVAVAICYDAHRRHVYETIKDQPISLILFPHGSPSDPGKVGLEVHNTDDFCNRYLQAFDVPVVYVNSRGKLDSIMGTIGKMMAKTNYALNGLSAIYARTGSRIDTGFSEGIGWAGDLVSKTRQQDIIFYGDDITKGNRLFRKLILEPDIRKGIRYYEANKRQPRNGSVLER